MASNASALVLVQPTDSVESIVAKLRETGSDNIQLLVPDDTASLQALGGFAWLREAVDRDRIGVMVISSDDKTLNAARLNQFDVVGVEGARVVAPPQVNGNTVSNPYATQVLPAEPPPGPIDPQDAQFLNELDRVPVGDPYGGLIDDDADTYAELDDLSDTMSDSPVVGRAARIAPVDLDDDWESFDSAPPRRQPDYDDDFDKPLRRGELARGRPGIRRGVGRAELAVPSKRYGRADRLDLEEDEEYAPRRRTSPLLIVLLVLLALALIFLAWAYSNRVTVTVAPPPAAIREEPFENEVIPLASSGTAADTAAVQAVAVSASAEASVQGQASEQLSPVGVARGTVQVINALPNPIELPEGTEFIATNGEGQEVRFLIDAPATVPPAVTSTSLFGSSTQNGTVEVQISARSPGSASNVGENAITQMVIPGQGPVQGNGTLRLLNRTIEGGSEAMVAVVSEEDVRRVLGEALSMLYQQGVAALQSQPMPSGYGVDEQVISPNPQQLGDPQSYEQPVVSPPVGQVIENGDRTFTVTVRATFNALATPPGKPVRAQLGPVVTEYIAQRGDIPCGPQDKIGIPVRDWNWDGQRLTIDGAITCTPSGALTDETLAKVQNAIRGQSYDAAVAGLDQLQKGGLIGDYQLPAISEFPRFDLLLNVQEQSSATAESSPISTTTTTTTTTELNQ